MRVGILGTGGVGRALGSRLIRLGDEVRLGSRSATNEAARAWVEENGDGASQGTFADAAEYGEIVVNATSGGASLEALRSAGEERLGGKVLVDVANVIDSLRRSAPRWTPASASRSSVHSPERAW